MEFIPTTILSNLFLRFFKLNYYLLRNLGDTNSNRILVTFSSQQDFQTRMNSGRKGGDFHQGWKGVWTEASISSRLGADKTAALPRITGVQFTAGAPVRS